MLAMLGMSGQTSSGEDRLPEFIAGRTAQCLQKIVDDIIINEAAESMLNYRRSLISISKKTNPKTVELSMDGTYNDTGNILPCIN